MKVKNIFLTTVLATLSGVAMANDAKAPATTEHAKPTAKGETVADVAEKTKNSLNKAGSKLGAKIDHILKGSKKKATNAHTTSSAATN
mgnify:CR=1 FL=1